MAMNAFATAYELLYDGKTVWVNGLDGSNLGRFSRMGYDVHHPVEKQMKGDVCLLCTHSLPDLKGWVLWRDRMEAMTGLKINDEAKPKWVK